MMGPPRTPSRTRRNPRWGPSAAALLAAALLATGVRAAPSDSQNGFDLRSSSVPIDEILRGGPPRDGIPALDAPATVTAAEAAWSDDEMVVGVTGSASARAYPLAILVWHELVNDSLDGRPILISYCPLCGTAVVFDRRVGDRERHFGVSGLLYQSDLLMFDRETESLWSQISAEAVTGPSRKQRLSQVRSQIRPWGDWKRTHPETTILAAETGYHRPYGRSPYGGYNESKRLMFPAPLDARYHPKMRTVGLRLADGTARAYPLEEIRAAGGSVEDVFAGHAVKIRLDPEAQFFEVEAPDAVEVIEGFWFAWVAFHPQTTVFSAP